MRARPSIPPPNIASRTPIAIAIAAAATTRPGAWEDATCGARLRPPGDALLDLDLGALLLESCLDLLGFVLGHAFLDGLGRCVDEILGFLEAQTGQLANDLDDRDLVRPDLGERCRELGLLLDRSRGRRLGRRRSGGCGCRSSGGHAVSLLESLDELGKLEDRHL